MISDPSSTSEQTWPWPDSLDALVAAPDYHKLLFENQKVRVLHTRIPPGATAPIHTHRWPCVVFIQSWSDCIRRDHLGSVWGLTAKLGDAETQHAYMATTVATALAGKHR